MVSGTKVVGVLKLCSVGTLITIGVWQYTKYAWDERKLKNLLDEEVDAIATDFVSDDGRHNVPPSTTMVVYEGGNALMRIHEAVIEPQTELVHTRGVAALNMAKVDIDQHRGVARKKRGQYINTVVAECRLTFGVPNRNEANEKAVRRVAVKIMKTHGVRPTHMNAMLPQVVELVFIPTNADIQARLLSRGWAAWFRTWRWSRLAPPSTRC